jgi:hypothetical protein
MPVFPEENAHESLESATPSSYALVLIPAGVVDQLSCGDVFENAPADSLPPLSIAKLHA